MDDEGLKKKQQKKPTKQHSTDSMLWEPTLGSGTAWPKHSGCARAPACLLPSLNNRKCKGTLIS